MGEPTQWLTAEKIVVDSQSPTETAVDEVLESLGDVIADHLAEQLDGTIHSQRLVDHFAANCDVAAAKAAIFRLIERGLLRAAAVRSGQGKVALDQIELLPTAEFWRWDAEEEIQRLRTHWPTWDQQGIYKPQDSIDRLWNKLARVPGLIPPHCPRLPVVDFVDRLRGKAEEEIKGQRREFHDALSVAQRAIAGATQQTTTGSGTTAGTAEPTGQGEQGVPEHVYREWPSLSAAARERGLSKATVKDWTDKGYVTSYRYRNQVKIDMESLRRTHEKRRPDE